MADPAVAPATPYGGAAGDRYPQLLRTPKARWWRPLLGLLLAVVTLVLLGSGIALVAVLVAVLTGTDADVAAEESLSADSVLGLLANNLIITALIPAALLAVLVAHRERVGWLGSVAGRLRWRALVGYLPLAAAVVVVFFGLTFLVPGDAIDDVDVPDAARLTGLLAVILLTTPLQAAGEEFAFRGYLTQAVASWFARPLAGTLAAGLVSATLFALAHGSQEPWLFADRFAFGAVASWVVWRTGGLEAAIVLHAVNNLVSLGFTAVTGSIEEALTASELDWPYAVLDVAMMAVFAVLADRLARRRGLAVVRPPDALRPAPPVGPFGAPGPPGSPGSPGVLSPPPGVGYPVHRPEGPQRGTEGNPWGMG